MIIILVGPSAVGKTTLAAELVSRGHIQLVSCTTRPPRHGEVHGRDYWFISQEEFGSRIARGEFAEHSGSFDHSYGLLKSEIEAVPEDRCGIAVLDVHGALALRKSHPESTVSFALYPASWEVLETRLLERGGDPREAARRLNSAKDECHMAVELCDVNVRAGRVQQAASEIMVAVASFSYRVPGCR